MNALGEAARKANVLVCVGPGGVGKTTVAAALALRSALEGQGALVCTIDPAKRLANALGLEALGNAETLIDAGHLAKAGLSPKAPMRAMMLDMKRTWDELIEKRAQGEARQAILGNRFYQSLSTALAGSQEYIAMEKLCELRLQRDYPLIVLDTPPTAHALDFLDAPNRILDFLDQDAMKWVLTPALKAGKAGLKLFNLGGGFLTKQISKFIGTQTMEELAGFMVHMSGLYESFRERARQTRTLLEAPTTRFVLVTGPMPERTSEAARFLELLKEHRLHVAAVVVNRVHQAPDDKLLAQAEALGEPLKTKVLTTLREQTQLAAQDAKGVAWLKAHCGAVPIVEVPRFDLDVHDLQSLATTGRWLWGDPSRSGPAPH
ncbi:MAG: AAA family ATPase [Myxococcaceae bacterium]|nr:AAA family ATPase [Myxococcaceae bacterium]